MKKKRKINAKQITILFGIMLGIECFGRTIVFPINLKMSRISLSVTVYRVQEGKFPDSLDELTRPTGSTSSLLGKEDLIDPWREPIGYEYTDSVGDGFILWSSGPDRKIGTADDIVSGFLPLVEDWKARQTPAVVSQITNAVQKVTPGPAQPPAKVGGAKPSPARREKQSGDGNEQSGIEEEGKTKPHRLWRYAVIPLGLLAVLYFIRSKSKN